MSGDDGHNGRRIDVVWYVVPFLIFVIGKNKKIIFFIFFSHQDKFVVYCFFSPLFLVRLYTLTIFSF